MQLEIKPDGDKVVTVRRNCILSTGDKLATQHGQKGIAYLMGEQDMPCGIAALVEYCSIDCQVAVEVWERTSLEDKISSMACTFKCPVYDVVTIQDETPLTTSGLTLNL